MNLADQITAEKKSLESSIESAVLEFCEKTGIRPNDITIYLECVETRVFGDPESAFHRVNVRLTIV